MKTIDTKTAARSRVALALYEIEIAQESLRRASELLCPILGFADQWEATGKLHLRVKSHWHKVKGRDHGDYDLDESARAALGRGQTI